MTSAPIGGTSMGGAFFPSGVGFHAPDCQAIAHPAVPAAMTSITLIVFLIHAPQSIDSSS